MNNNRRRLLIASQNQEGGREIEFYLSYYSEILKYTAMSNMTWAEFIASEYNIDNKFIEHPGRFVYFYTGHGMPYPIMDGSSLIIIDDYVKPNHQYIVYVSAGGMD